MNDRTSHTIYGATNRDMQSCKIEKCDCSFMWSLAQQFSYMRLSVRKTHESVKDLEKVEYSLLMNYSRRARIIAATYARFYLEKEDGGNPSKKGRYYWMGLGAFASKTVAFAPDNWRKNPPYLQLNSEMKENFEESMAKGNFWLFMDIAPWHWYYSHSPESFDDCEKERDTSKLVPTVRKNLEEFKYGSEAFSKINNLKTNAHIHEGFNHIKKYEEQQIEKNSQPFK